MLPNATLLPLFRKERVNVIPAVELIVAVSAIMVVLDHFDHLRLHMKDYLQEKGFMKR
ncbi:hypothetical protein D3C81_2202060 [compost metagenome]